MITNKQQRTLVAGLSPQGSGGLGHVAWHIHWVMRPLRQRACVLRQVCVVEVHCACVHGCVPPRVRVVRRRGGIGMGFVICCRIPTTRRHKERGETLEHQGRAGHGNRGSPPVGLRLQVVRYSPLGGVLLIRRGAFRRHSAGLVRSTVPWQQKHRQMNNMQCYCLAARYYEVLLIGPSRAPYRTWIRRSCQLVRPALAH